jgi:hypothetical protein
MEDVFDRAVLLFLNQNLQENDGDEQFPALDE